MKKNGLLSRIILLSLPVIAILAGVIMLAVVFINESPKPVRQTNQYMSTMNSRKNVLLITAASEDYSVYRQQLTGLRSVYSSDEMSFNVEFLDSKRDDSIKNEESIYARLKYKLESSGKPDAVVVCDDESLSFVQKYQDSLFHEIPVIFFGVDDYERAVTAVRNPYITGSVHLINVSIMVDTAKKINPELKSVVGIYDDTLTGCGYKKQFYSFEKLYPSVRFTGIDLSELTRDEFVIALRNLPENCAVIHLYATTDKSGRTYTVKDITNIINENVLSVPVFSVSKEAIDEGLLGGSVVNAFDSAVNVAKLADEVIEKGNISSVSLNMRAGSTFYINEQTLNVKHYSKNLLPKRTVYCQTTSGIFKSYGKILIPFACIFVGLIVLLIEAGVAELRIKKEKKNSDYNATHDYLTNLLNRRQASVELSKVINSDKDFAVLLMDIDDFKNINDFFSHGCGDCVLKEEARRLMKISKEDKNYVIGRFGGDEFVIIYKGGFMDENSLELYNLRSQMNEPILYNDKKLFIKVSIGIVNSYQTSRRKENIMTDVDIALYEAKNKGKNCCVFFTKDMKKIALRNDEVSKKLENALQKDEFKVMYQPQIDVTTGKIYGYEALTRLSDYSFPPSVFIPIAEEYGYISKLGRIVTEKVIEQMADWKNKGIELHQVAINFSSGQLGDLDYPNFLKGLLEKYDIPSDLIEIEITESLFMSNSNYAKDLFAQFEAIGVKMALDDFGTGYSSLSYLTYMPVDTVKIDKSMVDNYLVGERESSFIKNISRLVHGLGMKLTVEGVEEKWQLEKLKQFHADYIQGYYYSKPISGEDVEKFKVEGE